MDNSDLRRGRPTLHKKTDDATAILAGDGLLTLAFDIITRDEIHSDPTVRLLLTRALARASGIGGMVGGQMLDLAGEGRFGDREPVDVARLQQMKTGALLRYRLHRRRDPRPVLAKGISGARRLRPRARRSVPDRRRPARRRGRRRGARQADRPGRGTRQDHLRHPARHRRRQAARARPAGAGRCRALDLRRQGRRAARRRALRRRTQELKAPMADKEAEDPLLVRFRKMPKPVRVVYARPRTFISIADRHRGVLPAAGIAAAGDAAADRLGYLRRALSGAGLHHDVSLRARAYQAQRGAAGRRPLPDPAGDRARRLRQHRRDRVRARRIAAQRAGAGAGDRDHRAVLGRGAHHLRAALRA